MGRNRRTRATRRISLARNDLARQPVFSAQLAWAPDDAHLAVAVAPVAAINALSVITALRARDASTAPPMPPCAGENSGCLDPAFDVRRRLTFLKRRDVRPRSYGTCDEDADLGEVDLPG